MNNLQALNNLQTFGERQKAEQERLIKEILQQNLQNLRESFTKEYKESLNTIENEIRKQIIHNEGNIIKLSSESDKKIQAELEKIHKQVRTTQENIKAQNKEPMKFKLTTILYSFLCGILVAIILSLIVWYQWIRPYQVSKGKTITTESGENFIQMSEEELIKRKNKFYFRIQ